MISIENQLIGLKARFQSEISDVKSSSALLAIAGGAEIYKIAAHSQTTQVEWVLLATGLIAARDGLKALDTHLRIKDLEELLSQKVLPDHYDPDLKD